ncbi:MAG: hypothetical protein GXY38_13695 [Planctomycetes bacterium]|jgi:hypothetical protein|nr:hypothetical protein [Planctomycetota bacterium]
MSRLPEKQFIILGAAVLLAALAGCDSTPSGQQQPIAYVPAGPSPSEIFMPVQIGAIQTAPGDWMGRGVVVNGVVTAVEEPGIFTVADINTRINRLMVVVPRNPDLITSRLNEGDVVQVSGRVELFTAGMLNTYPAAFGREGMGPTVTPSFYSQHINRPALVADTIDWLTYTR